MNIYELLKNDHETQRALCADLLKTEGDSAERQDKWRKLRVELEAHAAAEEQTFYSALMEHPEATEKARHSVHEHQEMTKLISELEDTDMSSGGWLNKFKKLAHDVEHHLDEEEKEIFPKARNLFSDSEEAEMAGDFRKRKPAEVKDQKKAS